MSDTSYPQWSAGNDGFGYPGPESFVRTPNPIIQAEAQLLVDIVTNRGLPKWERENAYRELTKQYGHWIEPDDAELFCSRDTDSDASDSDVSDSDASEASDSDDSEQCPGKSSDTVASQSMGQQLLPDKSDSKTTSKGD